MLTDMHVLASDDLILLDLPADTAVATLGRLEQFLFSEDVQLASVAETLTGVWVHGPHAAATLERTLDGAEELGAWGDYRHARLQFDGEPVSVARIDQLGVPGFCVFLERARESRFAAALQSAGARPVGHDALEAARIEAGYPVFGIDMTEATIPLEAGIEPRAISFTKGCYVGQEVIIRVLHRGGGRVAKKLVAMRVDDRARRGAKVFSGERLIGELTSTAVSPQSGAIALGYLHRDFTVPGTAVDVELGAARCAAIVTGRPMVSANQ
jgi:folate-binding protein YgfZ